MVESDFSIEILRSGRCACIISLEILKPSLKKTPKCSLHYTYYHLGRMVMQILLSKHLIKQQGEKKLYSQHFFH